MKMYCYICKSKNSPLKHYLFPRNPELRRKWLKAFGLKGTQIMRHTRICDKHFDDSCFYVINRQTGRKMLLKESVPSLFLKRPKKFVKRIIVAPPNPSTEQNYENPQPLAFVSATADDSAVPDVVDEDPLALDFPNDDCVPDNSTLIPFTNFHCRRKKQKWRSKYVNRFDKIDFNKCKWTKTLAIRKISSLKKTINKLQRKNLSLLKTIQNLKGRDLLTDEAFIALKRHFQIHCK